MARQVDCQVDKRGRMTLPKTVREQLGINGQSADLRLSVEVLETHGETNE